MLGYVKTDSSELKMREYEFYRGIYCGLCRRMGKCTGQCSRLSLNYDFVFLAAVRMALIGEVGEMKPKRCLLHPIRRRLMMTQSPTLDYCADACALLVHHKLLDDRCDERGARRLRARAGLLFFCRGYRSAKRRHPHLDEEIRQGLDQLRAYERGDHSSGVDAPADLFGRIMRDVFASGLSGDAARIAGTIGQNVGHWIYLADAVDDFYEDRKRNRYNPLADSCGTALTSADVESLRTAMTLWLSGAERAFLLIDLADENLKGILNNIFYSGLPAAAERIFFTAEKRAGQPSDTEGKRLKGGTGA